MVSWNDAKELKSNDKKDIERLKLGAETKIRLVGDVLPRYVYWVTTTEGKRHPLECLRFNREQQKFDDNVEDPFKELPEDVYSEAPTFSYICNVIDRADGKIKLFDVKSTIYRQIVSLATNGEYGNPADENKGYDITIKKEKTGPLVQNVKYSCLPARSNSKLTDEEKALELFDLSAIFKRPTYKEQKEWLLKNTTLFAGSASDEMRETAEDLK